MSPHHHPPPSTPEPPFEFRSKSTLLGLPLLHITGGIDPRTHRPRGAHGSIAIGPVARGFVALGGITFGFFSFGGLSAGVVAVGGLTAGIIALGGVAIALLAPASGLAIAATYASGGLAIAPNAFGGVAIGHDVAGGFTIPLQPVLIAPLYLFAIALVTTALYLADKICAALPSADSTHRRTRTFLFALAAAPIIFAVFAFTPAPPASSASATIRYRVFELPADLLDQQIPPTSRTSAELPDPDAVAPSEYTGSPFTASAQTIEVPDALLATLLRNAVTPPGLLTDGSRFVDYWPRIADSWNYSFAQPNFLGGGGATLFLGIRSFNRQLQLRVEGVVTHDLDTRLRAQAPIIWHGNAPSPNTSRLFLVPFFRKNGDPEYLVIANTANEPQAVSAALALSTNAAPNVFTARAFTANLPLYNFSIASVRSVSDNPTDPSATIAFDLPESQALPLLKRFPNETLPAEIFDRTISTNLGQGALAYMANAFNPETASLPCTARIRPNPGVALLTNQNLTLRLLTDVHPNALLIPMDTIADRKDSAYVLVVNKDQTLEERPITTGANFSPYIEVLSGIAPDDAVVLNPDSLHPGTKIHPLAPPVPTNRPSIPGRWEYPGFPLARELPAALLFDADGTYTGTDRSNSDHPLTTTGTWTDDNNAVRLFKDATKTPYATFLWDQDNLILPRHQPTGNLVITFHKSTTPTTQPSIADPTLQIKFDYAEKQLEDMEARQRLGRAAPIEVLRATAARDIAAAEIDNDPAKVADIKYKLAAAELHYTQSLFQVGRTNALELEKAQLTRDLAAAATQPASSQDPDRLLRIQFNHAREAFKIAEAEHNSGVIDGLDYLQIKADYLIAAAQLTHDPAQIAQAKFNAAEELAQTANVMFKAGVIGFQQVNQLQLARDLAAAATQPAPSQKSEPTTEPAATLPPLPGRWETTKITDDGATTITHITLLFSPDHTLEGRSDFKDNTHITAKGTWSSSDNSISVTLDDETQKLTQQKDTLLLTIKNEGDTLFTFKKTSPDPTFPPAPDSPSFPNQ